MTNHPERTTISRQWRGLAEAAFAAARKDLSRKPVAKISRKVPPTIPVAGKGNHSTTLRATVQPLGAGTRTRMPIQERESRTVNDCHTPSRAQWYTCHPNTPMPPSSAHTATALNSHEPPIPLHCFARLSHLLVPDSGIRFPPRLVCGPVTAM